MPRSIEIVNTHYCSKQADLIITHPHEHYVTEALIAYVCHIAVSYTPGLHTIIHRHNKHMVTRAHNFRDSRVSFFSKQRCLALLLAIVSTQSGEQYRLRYSNALPPRRWETPMQWASRGDHILSLHSGHMHFPLTCASDGIKLWPTSFSVARREHCSCLLLWKTEIHPKCEILGHKILRTNIHFARAFEDDWGVLLSCPRRMGCQLAGFQTFVGYIALLWVHSYVFMWRAILLNELTSELLPTMNPSCHTAWKWNHF